MSEVLRPGFPGLIDASQEIAVRSLVSYLQDIASTDVNRLANLRSKPVVIEQLLTALAR